ncbi:CynX/NimT family MFS transporter [Cognatishimia sp. F0-27]|uniref:MFS transporter n=1 Tax=Cognatishimia sp. F0-27 TaxID=2816855 RepID=UPI001D0C3EDA|nr:MFS transporter [Cognatishimia sp. F0-27]
MLALLFLARVGLGFQFQTLGAVGDELVMAFALDWSDIGLLIGLFMAPGLVLALPAGYLGRFVPDRPMVVGSLLLLVIGGVLSAIATHSATIGAGRLIAGAGFLFVTLYCSKMVADWFEGREIATAMSIFVMSWPFGIAMGQIGHVWLAGLYGWQMPFIVASLYCLGAAVAVFALYTPPEHMAAGRSAASAHLTAREWLLIGCAGLAWAVFNAGYVTYLSFGPVLLEGLGHGAIAAAGLISVASWIMILSGAVCGQLADRFGHPMVILAVCMAGAVSALFLIGLPGFGLAGSLLFGLIGMAPAGVIMAMAGQALRPQVRAFGMGVFFSIYHAVMMATPPIAGRLLDQTGQADAPILLAMGLFALVLPCALAFTVIKTMPGPGSFRAASR